MKQRKAILLSLFIFLILAVSYVRLEVSDASALPDPEDIDGSALANIPPVEDAIRSIQNRLKENPRDAVSFTLLGDLYMRQARETGNASGYQLAEVSLLEALDLLPNYAPASVSLASVYYSQHEFEKALALADQVYKTNNNNSQARILMADAYLSLGDYKNAEIIYDELEERNPTPPLLARIAYLEELNGNTTLALDLIRRAAADALQSGGTKENAAWYLLRVGDMYFNSGEIKEASRFYDAALRVYENYHLALAGLGKVRAAEGKYEEAIGYYQQAANIVPQPDFFTALGDLYIVTGQPDQARIQYETVETIGTLAELNEQIYNRQLANFYSDHGLNLEQALELALAELNSRKDIYGYDAVAWAHYKNGNFEEAQTLIGQALALGTRDARLYYHAGMISFALGDEVQARKLLEEALLINPHFSLLDVETARATLEALQIAAGR